jgi:hypothetical protein
MEIKAMTTDYSYIKEMIATELADAESTENMHGIIPEKHLVEPRLEQFKKGFGDEGVLSLVVVLQEFMTGNDGYWIVFDPENASFGLAVPPKENGPAHFLGYYGGFVDTLVGM